MHGAGFEKANIIGTWPSVEQSMAGTLNIDMCLAFKNVSAADVGAPGPFRDYFKTFITAAFPPPQKRSYMPQHRISSVLN
jgi:hypothetical protein